MSSENILPELWYKIFSYLSHRDLFSASQVNKQWDEMAFDPRLWTKIILGDEFQTSAEITKILQRCHLVTDITLIRINNWNGINSVPKFKFLRTLEFNSCVFSSTDIEKLTRCFGLIESLKIQCKDENFKDILHEIIKWKFLKRVDLTLMDSHEFFQHPLNFVVDFLAQNCEQLKELNLTFGGYLRQYAYSDTISAKTTKVTVNCIRFICDDYCVLGNFSRVSSLRVFDIRMFHDKQLMPLNSLKLLEELCIELRPNTKETDCFLYLFCDVKFLHLSTLRLSQCTIDDDEVLILAESCPNLKTLEISCCDSIEKDGFLAFWIFCRRLENISLIGLKELSTYVTEFIPRCLRNLKNLFIEDCPQITDEFIAKFKEDNPNISFEDKRLKHLCRRENNFKIRFD